MNTNESIEQIFKCLAAWIPLPEYQAERRLDIFFGLYMEQILKATKKTLFAQDDELVLIPEFPLRKEITAKQKEDLETKGQRPRKLSNKIDYLVVNKTRREIHAVELKTDSESVKQSQIDYYKKEFKEKTVADLLAFLEEIIAKKGHHKKYDNLVRYMKDNGVENESRKADYATGEVIYLIPYEKHSAHIRVTPYFVSHSTYDAHMLLVETDCQRILHTGDYRRHGYLGKGLLPTLKNIGQVDYLITEGTMLGRAEACESEAEVSRRMADVMRAFKFVFVLASATDIERLAAVNDAAKKSGRMLMASSLSQARMTNIMPRFLQTPTFSSPTSRPTASSTAPERQTSAPSP